MSRDHYNRVCWHDWEDRRLIAMFEVGRSDREIARHLGRSAVSVTHARKRLGLRRKDGAAWLK